MSKQSEGPVCVYCGQPATCLGAYEGDEEKTYACDTCCGHGNEDGHCKRLSELSKGEVKG